MSKPQLPRSTADAWEVASPFTEPHDVRAIEARGGLVVAGGANLYALRPGENNWKFRPPPEDIGPVHAVAAEPRGARRYAVASEKMFALFFKNKQGDQLLRLKPDEPGSMVTQLAWGGDKGPCALWVLRDDHALLRMRPDLSDLDEMELDEIDAICSDDAGVVAMVSLRSERQIVYVTKDGAELKFRVLDPEISPDASVQLAVADTAVALVVDEEYVLLSRGLTDPFVRVEGLDFPTDRGWSIGAVAFQGTKSDSALLCARWESETARVVRVDPSGAAMSIVEVAGDETRDAPNITSLSWDASRQTLWAASPDLGIFSAVAPGAKGRKKVSLS